MFTYLVALLLYATLPHPKLAPSFAGMSTLTKPRAKPLSKSVPRVKTVARAKLTPPPATPAKFAREVMADYPAPKPRAAAPLRVSRPNAAALPPRLVPPPGRKASEIADLLPPPDKNFDAAWVEKIVACRSDR